MTDEQILLKSINIAKNNGLILEEIWILSDNTWLDFKEKVIFSHKFAKAFWGEENNDPESHYYEIRSMRTGHIQDKNISLWQIHLQQMVLEKNPLKYIERFLK